MTRLTDQVKTRLGASQGLLLGDEDGSMTATLYRGGSIYAPGTPRATAMLVDGQPGDARVAWIGSEQAADGLGATDRVVDLGGALVAPAFVDAHVHVRATGLALLGLDLSDSPSLMAALERISAAAADLPPGTLLQATGWDETRWPEQRAPTPRELERAAGGRPAHLVRVDGHSAVASAALLAVAGLPAGAQGGASVLLGEQAQAVAVAAQNSLTPGRRREAQRAALRRAAQLGIGSLHEMAGPALGGAADLQDLMELALQEPLPDVVPYWGGDVATAVQLGAQAGGDLFVDGSLGSRTAALSAPYADDATTSGQLRLTTDEVAGYLVEATRAGLQAGFHAIGDQAVATVLQGAAAAAAKIGLPRVVAARHRLEHASMVRSDLVADLARLGLVASVQPAFSTRWGGPGAMYEQRLGRARADAMLPLHALAEHGVPLAFGSDAPVLPMDPWEAVRSASTRAAQAISGRAAFAAATRGGERAARRDGSGVLRPGAPATFAVWSYEGDLTVQTPDARVAAWSTDPRAATPGLPDLTGPAPACLSTVVRGRAVFDAGRGYQLAY